MSSLSLEDWNKQFADGDEAIDLFAPKAKGFSFDLDVAYSVRVREAKVIRSSKGDVQLQLDLDVMDGEDKLGDKREWLTLPKQQSDLKLTREQAEKATQRRFEDMLRVLSAAYPKDFRQYAERIDNGSAKATFKDFDGKVMEGEAFALRDTARKTKCVKWTDALHGKVDETIDDLEGTSLYIVKATNKRDARYPYTNWYDAKPRKTPVFSKHNDGSIPF